ncbi:MAG: universal stress protein [Deltaproteobacteria bacterium]|nr:universal stress protein [Deltaproteobacteria bacterium]
MYPKVLVPLDGSELAECALEEVKKLVKGGLVREIVLFSVIAIPQLALGEGIDYQQFRKSHFDGFQEYLEKIRSRIASAEVMVNAEVQEGNPAQMIINYVRKNAVDLIVIATHGYSGMKKLMFGSVALQVLHDADVPVLLIRPTPPKE